MSPTVTSLHDSQKRFVQLLDQHAGIIAKVAHTYCWEAQDREELAQDIVTQLWRSFPGYDSAQSFSTWMYRVALNVAISGVRRTSVRRRYMSTLGDQVDELPSAGSVEDERLPFLRQFIADLDPLNRALMLLYLEGHSHREIAQILGISSTNVATKISRLKQRVRTQHATTIEKEPNDGT